MNEKQIARINELYHKSKNEGLTEKEKKEQTKLRKKYIEDIKKNMTSQLDSITVVNPDGTSYALKDKRKKE